MLKELITNTRSYRRFHEDYVIGLDTLRELVDLARLGASASNIQSLRYILSCDREKNALIFPNLGWAGYLKDWRGPSDGERPSAYIIILDNTKNSLSFGCDYGIAAQNIMLGAIEKGLGGCMIASINRDSLREALNIPILYNILLVTALGRPKEKVVIETVGPSGDIKYWRDENDVHHVPKRLLEDIIIG